jgi:hypothetical protein
MQNACAGVLVCLPTRNLHQPDEPFLWWQISYECYACNRKAIHGIPQIRRRRDGRNQFELGLKLANCGVGGGIPQHLEYDRIVGVPPMDTGGTPVLLV